MAEYIKRTRVMTICERYSNHCFKQNDAHGQHIADDIFDDVVDLTPEDVVPVVRCCDCKHIGWVQEPCHGKSIDWCKLHDICIKENDYCSYGERKVE